MTDELPFDQLQEEVTDFCNLCGNIHAEDFLCEDLDLPINDYPHEHYAYPWEDDPYLCPNCLEEWDNCECEVEE